MSVRRLLVDGVLFESLGNFFVKIFSIIGYLLVIRNLSIHDYSVFVILVSLMGPIAAIVFFGFDRIFVQVVSLSLGTGNYSRIKGIVRDYYVLAGLLAVLSFTVLFFVKKTIAGYYDIYLLQYFWPLAFLITLQLIFNAIMLIVESSADFKFSAILKTSESLSRAMFVIFFASKLTLPLLFIIYGVAKGVAILIGLVYFIRFLYKLSDRKEPLESGVLFGILKQHGKWEIVRNVFDQFMNPLKLLIIKLFVNIQAVAVYDVAQNINSVVSNAFPIRSVLFPILSKIMDQKQYVAKIITKAKKYTILIYVFLYAAILIFLPTILRILAPQYSKDVFIFYLVLFDIFLVAQSLGKGPIIYGLKLQKFVFMLSPFTAASDILFTVIGAYLGGFYGVIIAMHIDKFIFNVIINHYLEKRMGFVMWTWKGFFSFDEDDKLLLRRIWYFIRMKYFKIFSYGKS